MLSRIADNLYWMSRYLERAENTVRLLDVTQTVSLMPVGANQDDLNALLEISGLRSGYQSSHHALALPDVLKFFTMDEANPGSIYNCLRMARDNAHAARGKITAEMWESINSTWLDMRLRRTREIGVWNANAFFDWVKERSHLFRGATYGTIMRTDAYQFIRLGTFVERADNSARILSVKFHRIEDYDRPVSVADLYQWTALLRSVGAFEAYQEMYRGEVTPAKVAEMLIFRPDFPRSLRWCLDSIASILVKIRGDAGLAAKRQSAELFARLNYGHMDDVLAVGLPEYLQGLMADIADIGDSIRKGYLEAV
ncbi:MAG: alpha-E domain-containing protein [Gammaproteobacteria bacterium]|nr:MAG: alpha-E domain-containing protein [Gammaproteobacteria bacterium]